MKHDELFKLAVISVNSPQANSTGSIPPLYKETVKKMYATLSELDEELRSESGQISDEDLSEMMKNPLGS